MTLLAGLPPLGFKPASDAVRLDPWPCRGASSGGGEPDESDMAGSIEMEPIMCGLGLVLQSVDGQMRAEHGHLSCHKITTAETESRHKISQAHDSPPRPPGGQSGGHITTHGLAHKKRVISASGHGAFASGSIGEQIHSSDRRRGFCLSYTALHKGPAPKESEAVRGPEREGRGIHPSLSTQRPSHNLPTR